MSKAKAKSKASKHYLEKKISDVEYNYAKRVSDKYSELKNIYKGKDKEGKRKYSLHKVKDRYEAAEAYIQNLSKDAVTAEEKKYIGEIARAFLEYDIKLDKKRKPNSEYKEAVRKKRLDHIGITLEALVYGAPEPTTPVKEYKTIDKYIEDPKPTQVTPILPPTLPTPISNTATPAVKTGPSLTSRIYQSTKGAYNTVSNATSTAYTATKNAVKKHWKKGVLVAAGLATACLLYYCANNHRPAVNPPKEKPKIEYVKPQQKPQTPPIIKKQQPPVIKKEQPKQQPPVIKKEQPPVIKQEQPKYEPPVIKEQPKIEQLLTEKDWTKKFKKGEIDFSKYDVFFSGMWYDPGAIVAYEKGSDKIKFDYAMSGDLMWDKVESKKQLDDLIWMMDKNNMFGSRRIALHTEYVKNKKGEILGVIFTDAISRSQVNLKDGKVMVYSINRMMATGGGGADGGSGGGSGGGSSGSGGAGGGGAM